MSAAAQTSMRVKSGITINHRTIKRNGGGAIRLMIERFNSFLNTVLA